MQPFYADCLDNLEDLHSDIEKALEGLPPDALDWSPRAGMNSITALVVHTVGAERFLFGEVLAGESFDRDREAEFRAQGIETSALIKRLADSRAYVAGVIEQLTLDDLDKKRTIHGREVTVGSVLGHALKHTATHLGHIQVMRDLWSAR